MGIETRLYELAERWKDAGAAEGGVETLGPDGLLDLPQEKPVAKSEGRVESISRRSNDTLESRSYMAS